MNDTNDVTSKNSFTSKWVSPSIWLAVSKPLSWLIILIGALSLFNMAKNSFGFELFVGTEVIDAVYTNFRNVVVSPIEWIVGVTLPAFMKNVFILYLTMARSFALSFNAIKESLGITVSDGSELIIFTQNEYEPMEGPVLKKFTTWEKWLCKISPARLEWLFRLIANFTASLFWPFAIPVLLKHPIVNSIDHFDSNLSVITEDGQTMDKKSRDAHHKVGPLYKFKSDLSERLDGLKIPPDPEPRYSKKYNARIIILTFLLAQVLIAGILITINGIGLIVCSNDLTNISRCVVT